MLQILHYNHGFNLVGFFLVYYSTYFYSFLQLLPSAKACSMM